MSETPNPSDPGSSGSQTIRNLTEVLLVLGTIGIVTLVWMTMIQTSGSSWRREQTRDQLKVLALAALNYSDAFKSFPVATHGESPEHPAVSWRVAILPFLEEPKLFANYDRSAAWDAPVNREVVQTILGEYVSPRNPDLDAPITNYFAVVGKGFIYDPARATAYRDIRDGASNTVLMVEYVPSEVKWAEPRDLTFEEFTAYVAGPRDSKHGGVFVAFADGSVRTLPEDMPLDMLYALFTIDGGEKVEFSD